MLIALGISGGIAAYKACEIVRGLDRAGSEVQVLMTRNATRFITPLTLQTLSRRKVLVDGFDLDEAGTIRHIELSREISALVVAPATACTLARFAQGLADDLLSTFYISVTAPVVVAPAMNTRMGLHPATRRNLELLGSRGVRIVEPETGWLAEGEIGWGRLAAPETIVAQALSAANRSRALAGKKVLITAGPTREAIDPVRFLSNRSSGRMGYALAEAAARRGAEVTLVSGPVRLSVPFGVRRVSVETVAEMWDAIQRERPGADAVFMAAAVSDHAPRAQPSKIKKTGDPLILTLDEGPDLLREMGAHRQESLLVGFAAETESLVDNARAKMERKNLDFIVANDVSSPEIGFESTENAVTILRRDGEVWEIGRDSKVRIAESILDRVFATDDVRSPA